MRVPNFQLEAGLTASLWDLFSSEGAPDAAMDALRDQLPLDDPRVRRLAEEGGRVWWPRRSPGPDLALITEDDENGVAEMLAVIEVKAGAATNWPSTASAAPLDTLPGTVSAAITQDYFGGHRTDEEFMSQADLYRSRRWWRESDGIALSDPDQALWLLFDTHGRSVEDAFRGASCPDAWIAIDLERFADRLEEIRRARDLTGSERDCIAVVRWHVAQALGRPLTGAGPTVGQIEEKEDAAVAPG